MIKRVGNHISSLHKNKKLLVLYGVAMFLLGIGLNYLITPSREDLRQQLREEMLAAQANQAEPAVGASDAEHSAVSLGFLPSELPEGAAADKNLSEENTEPENYTNGNNKIEELAAPDYSEYIYDTVVKKGDNFTNILTRAGVDRREAFFAGKALAKTFNPKNLRAGHEVAVIFKENIGEAGTEKDTKESEGEAEFVSLRIEEPTRYIEVFRNDEEKFESRIVDKELEKRTFRAEGEIENSLAQLADSLKIPPNILQEAVKFLSFDVDFQRDIRKGNKFEILYEEHYDNEGEKVQDGNMIYASLTVRGRDIKLYRFSPTGKDEDADYFTGEGRSIRKALMKTPINGAIISSHFGVRKHPISGYTRMHKGTDFAAPTGTPIYAAGDGRIVFIGRNGGYGKYVKIKHNAEYSTAYAHASRFARGMKKGRRVKQGQVVAYVGSTGASTGPHLHYEIHRNGKQVNPQKVNIPPGRKLNKTELSAFKEKQQEVIALLKDTPSKMLVSR